MALPEGLQTFLQDLSKAVLRECPVTDQSGRPLDDAPLLYDRSELYEFLAAYCEDQRARRVASKHLVLHDEGVVRVLYRALGCDELEVAELPSMMPLGTVLGTAEEVGLDEAVIDRVAQMTLRAGGQDECENAIDTGTPINALHYVALCLALVPTAGFMDTMALCVRFFRRSELLEAAFECFRTLDPRNSVFLDDAVTTLRKHPGRYDNISMILELGQHVPVASPPSSRPGTASGSRPGTATGRHPSLTGFAQRPVTPKYPTTVAVHAADAVPEMEQARVDVASFGSSDDAAQDEDLPAWVLRE
eukprot:TRINITY_DN13740_c0_g1_i1.p1 TRINITY_DN13740_c0_g1~~TRINITY_DN13740_c0_g1_i1.p1  ORF type:complete len:304 (+),score=62.92 TRINITY_DN13740_c0_g1_i1:74-985(+)